MASTISSTASLNNLDPSFVSIINNVLTIESQPLTKLQTQRDSVNVQKGVYTDLKGMVDGLKNAVEPLMSTNAFYSLGTGRKVSLSGILDTALNTSSTATVATVTAGSTAAVGSYQLSGVKLAKAQVMVSAAQVYGDQSLGWQGGFTIGGLAARSAGSTNTNSTVIGFSTSDVVSGQEELGSGPYYAEIRKDPNSATTAWQFRLVDEDGNAISVQKSDKTSFSTNWQAIPAADTNGNVAFDTGRGITVNFGTDSSAYQIGSRPVDPLQLNQAVKVDFKAAGAHIDVAKTDSLLDIANKINNAKYAVGNGVSATVVNNRMVLTASRTGVNHSIDYQDDAGKTLLADLGLQEKQVAKDGEFTLNNLLVTRSQNTGLTNVIAGATINLADDAENKSATISVVADASAQKSAIQTFMSKFNSLQTYLAAKTATTKQADGTYQRNALSGDTIFTSLRRNLFTLVSSDNVNNGTLKNLRQIGLGLDDNMNLTVTDSNALDKALLNDPLNAQKLIDKVMTGIDEKMKLFSGSNGIVDQQVKSADSQYQNINDRITTMTARLNKRKDSLTTQYAQLQAQLYMMQYTQQTMNQIYSTMSTTG
jgi:flagellar hook-associated protein 2